ncbi:MAG: LPXTG cell wall anchor domain-containing protein, partial [Lachnospiraceae bacterium]|nr:LPXTG cell wall anchor domain-containing protein [Lachnospiraceae bacterium]
VEIGAGEELPGATLQILDGDGNVVEIKDNDGNVIETCEWVSGTEPKYIEGLKTGVEYTLRETIAPDGYTITSDTKFTIDEKGVITSSGTTSKDENGVTILVVEDDLTHITVSKVDTGAGEELPGAKIQIIDEDGNVVEEWTSTTEPHQIDGLKTGVKYILREKVAPLGYTLTSDTTFTIDEYGKVTSTGTVNQEGMLVIEDTITVVDILKVDAKTDKGLAGAKLQVLDDNGTVCEEWTSTAEPHRIAGLYTGVTYTLHEVSAPKGYKVAKDVTFKIDEYGKVSGDTVKDGVVIMKDEQNPPPKNKTGDDANATLWALLMALAGSVLGGTVWFRRRRRV